MRRIRVIHWKAGEAGPLLEAVRSAGFLPDYDPALTATQLRGPIRETNPDAIVLDLNFRPALNRDVAAMLRGVKHCRHTPMVFVDGEPAKVENVRALLPDAVYVRLEGLSAALRELPSSTPAAPIVPPLFIERYKDRTTAQKLGVAPGGKLGVYDAPPSYHSILGDLPEGAEVEEEPDSPCPVTLVFVHDMPGLLEAARRLRNLAASSKTWLTWRKDSKNGVTQNSVRSTCLEFGLVDYKICSLDAKWSGMLFARRKEL